MAGRHSVFFGVVFFWFTFTAFAANVYRKDIESELRYADFKFIGSGTYGAVYEESPRQVVKISPLMDDGSTLLNVLEIALLKSLSHKAMPSPVGVNIYIGKRHSYLELHMQRYDVLQDPNAKFVLRELADLLSYLHSLNIVHRDIKPVHILKKEDGIVLVDWGSADIFSASPLSWVATTKPYRSPESLAGVSRYPKENDMWSVGVCAFELCEKRRLFLEKKKRNILREIGSFTNTNKEQDDVSQLATYIKKLNLAESDEAVRKLWNYEPATRTSADDLLINLSGEPKKATLAPLDKNIFSDQDLLLPVTRRNVYLWLQDLITSLPLHEKVLFEAMTIADRFIQTSAIPQEQYELMAMIAFYLAAGFYDDYISIETLIEGTDYNYTREQFSRTMFAYLANSDFKLLFNHSLREFQNVLYHELSPQNRAMAIMLLTMLEIENATFKKTNAEKWAYVMALLADEQDEENVKILLQIKKLCLSFRGDPISNVVYFDLIWNKVRNIHAPKKTVNSLGNLTP